MDERTRPIAPGQEGLRVVGREGEERKKDKRMAAVEERTHAAANIMKSKSQAAVIFELVEGTHFSPILPRLERAFEVVYG